MPTGLKRFQQTRQLHFLTFSCYQRRPLLGTAQARDVFENVLERFRQRYRFYVAGYVVMPEHVHLLITEPELGTLAAALMLIKRTVAHQLLTSEAEHFWQRRYYDFNVWSERKRIEKLRYIHRNPVLRGLVTSPDEWQWSSFRCYALGVTGVVEIESEYTARRREWAGPQENLGS